MRYGHVKDIADPSGVHLELLQMLAERQCSPLRAGTDASHDGRPRRGAHEPLAIGPLKNHPGLGKPVEAGRFTDRIPISWNLASFEVVGQYEKDVLDLARPGDICRL